MRPKVALARFRMWGEAVRRHRLLPIGLAALLPLLAAISVSHGAVAVPWRELPAALVEADHPLHRVVFDVRLARVAAGFLVGAALAAAGVLTQTMVRNPLADPGLLGVSGGAGAAAVAALIFAPEMTLLLPFVAFGGALGVVGLTLTLAFAGPPGGSPLRLILSGVALQALSFSAIALLTFFFADRAPAFVAFTVGSLAAAGWREAGFVAAGTVLAGLLAVLALRPLNLLALDDDSAAGVGLAVRRARFGAAALAALFAASAVAAGGLIGFVGLVVPNWVRRSTGPDLRFWLPASAAVGALLVGVADLLARTVASPIELPVGALLAAVGAPYFLFLIWRRTP